MNRLFLVLVSMVTLWISCAVGVAAERPIVFAVNYPLQYFAQRIAGDHAEVVFPAPPDVDPAFWRPDAATIGDFQHADIILLNGAGYAKWINRTSLPRRKLVDTSASFSDRYIETSKNATHSHGREGKHSHAGVAFTTWLDFRQAVEHARAVRNALSRRMPEQNDTFNENFVNLERELIDLDMQLKAIFERNPNKLLIASHPVYQYLARRYALNLKSVMWEPDILAPDSEWQALAELRKTYSADWMLWESSPNPENIQRLEALGFQSTVFDPCGNQPVSGDFLSVMKKNIENMDRLFR